MASLVIVLAKPEPAEPPSIVDGLAKADAAVDNRWWFCIRKTALAPTCSGQFLPRQDRAKSRQIIPKADPVFFISRHCRLHPRNCSREACGSFVSVCGAGAKSDGLLSTAGSAETGGGDSDEGRGGGKGTLAREEPCASALQTPSRHAAMAQMQLHTSPRPIIVDPHAGWQRGLRNSKSALRRAHAVVCIDGGACRRNPSA